MSSKPKKIGLVNRAVRQMVLAQHLSDHIEAVASVEKQRDAEVKAVFGFSPRHTPTVPSMGGAQKKRKR